MGKSLAGKELGQGITQRKDGRYQARFTNRFGKRQTIYAKALNDYRNTTRANYTYSYNRIGESLGWRKLNNINLITMQQAFNKLKTDIFLETAQYYRYFNTFNLALETVCVLENFRLEVVRH